jgi:hypothetical protein
MTYRDGFPDLTPATDTLVQSFGATPGDDTGPPGAGNSVSDTGGDSGLALTLNFPDLGLNDVMARAVQVGPLVEGDCQPCPDDSGSSNSSALNAHVALDTGADANSLATAPQSLCLPGLPLLSGLLGGSEYTGDHDHGTGSTVACGSTTGSATSGGGVDDAGAAHAGIDANVGLEGGTGGDVLSALLKGSSLLGDGGGADGLLNGAIVTADGGAGSDAAVSADPTLLPAIDGVLDGLVGSADLSHLLDCGCSSS